MFVKVKQQSVKKSIKIAKHFCKQSMQNKKQKFKAHFLTKHKKNLKKNKKKQIIKAFMPFPISSLTLQREMIKKQQFEEKKNKLLLSICPTVLSILLTCKSANNKKKRNYLNAPGLEHPLLFLCFLKGGDCGPDDDSMRLCFTARRVDNI
ncbi:hypothetical protein RFI_23308 [Reticulomyxa filosa]|uniref:Uncharacterized protein n=1 Tax=Reticulomyxa filosa TaxID=46433 RepID=X6MK74_RETFI|nr:hypothetical protein RFI_23308 [Reticulomyxa filosa]|eukprot:ETO14061.1 hypothetical protein RFI_23308 [Reticulomyxa filosa]